MRETIGASQRSYSQEFIFVYPALIVISLLLMSQAPVLALVAHDDWDFIFGGAHLQEKLLLNEGRPLTYLWSTISPRLLTPELAFLIFWLSLSHISHSFAKLLDLRSIPDQIFCAALVLLSTPVVELSGWASYHAAGLVTTVLGIHLLSAAYPKPFLYQLTLIGIFTFLTFLFYPAFAFMIFAAGMCLFRTSEFTKWGILICAFLISVTFAVVVVILVNYLAFDHLTITPESWRSPIYGTELSLVVNNIENLGKTYFRFLRDNLLSLSLLVAGWVYLVFYSRHKLLHALVIILIPLGFDLLLVGATGLMPNDRHFLYFPLSVLVSASVLFRKLPMHAKALLIVIISCIGIASVKNYTMSKVACGLIF
jgi:hypothetical protein